MLAICKTPLSIGLYGHACQSEREKERIDDVGFRGSLHMCDQSLCEFEVLSFEGRVSDLR